LTFYGTRGTLDAEAGFAYGEGGFGEVYMEADPFAMPDPDAVPSFKIDAETRLPSRVEGGRILEAPPDSDHMADFFNCMRTRKRPKADVESGYNHALATTMAGMSLRMGRRVVYDPTLEEVHPRQDEKGPSSQPC
jgi:hypothetical protein